ncbi:MAG: hypothetical protein R2738_04360 [Bacteroides graminisolvens]
MRDWRNACNISGIILGGKRGCTANPAASTNIVNIHKITAMYWKELSKEALAACPTGTAEKVVGIAFDTTGSTPAFTDAAGTPLALRFLNLQKTLTPCLFLWKDRLLKRLPK